MPSNSLRAVRMMPARLDVERTVGVQRGVDRGREHAGRVLAHEARAVGARAQHGRRRRPRQPRRGGDRHGAEHADRLVHTVRDERAGAQVAAVARRRDERDLGDTGAGDVAEVHHRPGREADRLDAGAQLGVRLELLRRLVAGDADVGGAQHDDRHAVVDQRDLDAVDHVDAVAGRQQRAARAAGDAVEVELDRGGRARHAVDRGVAGVVGQPAVERERGGGEAVGVDHEDPHRRRVRLRVGGDEPALDRERPDAGQQVAAVLLVGDDRLVDEDLQEQVVDVGVGAIGRADHRDLAGQRVGAADPVDLARVGRAHDPHQQLVALRRVGGQVVGEEVRALRRATPHQHAAHTLIDQHADKVQT